MYGNSFVQGVPQTSVPQGLAQTSVPQGLAQTSLIPNVGGGYGGYSTATMNYQYGNSQMTGSALSIPRAAALAVCAPTFQPQEGPQCVKCGVEWTMFTRKHHCRCCSREFCDNCSQGRADIKTLKISGERVCDFCVAHISHGDESCVSRLVPYLLENKEEPKSLALAELAGLLQNEWNMENISDLKLVTSLWEMLVQPTLATDNKIKGLGVLSLIASKGVSVVLSPERVEILQHFFAFPQTMIEVIKAIAFMAMQGQNKPLFISGRILIPLFNIMASGTDEMDLQWASMAVYYLASSSLDDAIPQGLGEINDVAPLIRLLSGQSEKLLQFVTGTLEIISTIPSNRNKIGESGGIDALVRLLTHVDSAIKTNVLGVLTNLCVNENSKMDIIQRGGITNLVELVDSTTDEQLQEQGVSLMVKLAQVGTHPALLQAFSAAIPFISLQLNSENATIRTNVLELMMSISKDPSSCAKAGVSGVVQALDTMLESLDENTPHATLKNVTDLIIALAQGCDENLRLCVDCGIISKLIGFLTSRSKNVVLESTKALVALTECPSFSLYSTADITGILLGVTMELLHTQFNDIQENVTRLLANLASESECAITLLRSPEELDKISKLLLSPQQSIQSNVAQLMCNLANVKGQTDTLGRLPGLLPTLIHLLGSPSPQVREQACFSLLECSISSAQNRQIVYNTMGGIATIIRLLAIKDPRVKGKAAEAVYFFSQEQQYRTGIRDAGGIQVIVENLFEADERVLEFSASTLSNIITNEIDAETIYRLGGVLAIINLLSSTFPSVVSAAAMAVTNIARSDICRRALVEGGALAKLLLMATSVEQSVQLTAIAALAILSSDRTIAGFIPQYNEGLPSIIPLLASLNLEIKGYAVQVVVNISRENPEAWSKLTRLGGLPVLSALASSPNHESQQLAVHEVAELSVDVERHSDIFTHTFPMFLDFLAEDPSQGKMKGSSLQLESLLIVANLSHDLRVLNAIVDHPSAISSIVSLLTLEYGEAPLFSSSRIIGNLTQYLTPTRPEVLRILHDSPGCLVRLASLLLLPAQGGLVKDPEIKYNSVASISSLILSDADVASLVSSGVVLGLVYMLQTPDELTHKHVVTTLKKMIKSPDCREQMKRSNECMSVLFESTGDAGVRYAVLEIISELAQQDSSALAHVPEGSMMQLLKVVTDELPSSTSKPLLLELLTQLSVGSFQIRKMLLGLPSFFSILLVTLNNESVENKSARLKSINLIGALSLASEGKSQIRSEGLLSVLLTLLRSHTSASSATYVNLLGSDLVVSSPTSEEEESDVDVEMRYSIVKALGALSLSEENRKLIFECQEAPQLILGFIINTSPGQTERKDNFLVDCLALTKNLVYNVDCKNFFCNNNLLQRLFSLLSESSCDKLTFNILSLIHDLTRDGREGEGEVVREYGMMPLVALMSSPNDYIITQSLQILCNLVRFDTSREVVQTYMDKSVLLELVTSPNLIVTQLAKELKFILGF
eukprot:TRINITY_DN624_c0_g1_i1.p1 TRINITY_DN624_c0_g1~~TRINITY_DN624_c0_g1_i1.p1  ORF type:complete len:1644 (+),score=307.65 TRINITY_DN624_c0_g1_i1:466-4932(+)